MLSQKRSGYFCTDVLLHTYAHHARYISTADTELAAKVYDLYKEDPSKLSEDEAEIEENFKHNYRGALVLAAAAVRHRSSLYSSCLC